MGRATRSSDYLSPSAFIGWVRALSLSPSLSRASCQEVGPSRAHPLWQGPFCNPPDSSSVATPATRSSDYLSPSAFIGGVWDLSLSLSFSRGLAAKMWGHPELILCGKCRFEYVNLLTVRSKPHVLQEQKK